MSSECYPISVLPHITRLYGDYLALAEQPQGSPLHRWYGSAPATDEWMGRDVSVASPGLLADALLVQAKHFGAGSLTRANVEKLRQGGRAVVTGQQVGLFGGPLLTLLKAATAIARAREATAKTGVDHVPIFWLATEDHDLAEVDAAAMLGKTEIAKLHLGLPQEGRPVGSVRLGEGAAALGERAAELLGFGPVAEFLQECYRPEETLGDAFGRWMTGLFAKHGLIVMDAAGREFHRLGAQTLRAAITEAPALEEALLARSAELERAGYHAQVLVKPGTSLLFLVHEETCRREALRRVSVGSWKAGSRSYTTAELLTILTESPERFSANALLRPVFQDSIVPTAAYVGGPAEVAYFAQSSVLYQRLLGRVTPVLPRLSATLIEPVVAGLMASDEVSLEDIFEAKTTGILSQRLGARAIPIEGKRRLAAVGNAMENELEVLTGYLAEMDASLGRSAAVSASKMSYQMNRLRRMAATFEVQKEARVGRHAAAMMLHLFPEGHPQERVVAGAWFLARAGFELIDRLVEEAGAMCLGHEVVRL